MEWEFIISLSVNFVFYINIHNEKQLYLPFVCVYMFGLFWEGGEAQFQFIKQLYNKEIIIIIISYKQKQKDLII